MTSEIARDSKHGNAYNIFILVLTIISLIIMVLLLLPINEATLGVLRFYDDLICIIFLIDFFSNLKDSSPRSDYFIEKRGWLDLLGSIPSFGGVVKFGGLLRLARISRLARIMRRLQGENKKALIEDVIRNRSQYVGLITILLAIIILAASSVLVLEFESKSPAANIHTGWDAFWYSVVTLTTVGYGDRYPVTFGGRVTAMFIMFLGVGIIGVLASILSSVLVGKPQNSEEEKQSTDIPTTAAVEQELVAIKKELAEIRAILEK
jgi:voltage-gated potassium channel